MTNRRRIRTGACDLKRKSGLIFGAALVSVALAACGGGDGDSPAAVVAPPSPPPSSVANINTPSPNASVPTANVPSVARDDAGAGEGDVVVASVPGTTTLSWTPPTLAEDGTPLRLTGYRIYWGQQKGYYTSSVTVDNPGLTRYVVEQLPAATWYFVATALSERGESEFSNEIAMRVL
jgi:hypothetical protein